MKRVKKLMLFVCMACFAIVLPFAFTACDNGSAPTVSETAKPTEMTLRYDQTSGIISWDAVENVVTYTVSSARNGENIVSKETTETKIALTLKKGSTRIAVAAFDKDGSERGAGSTIVTLAYDFGAPAAPTELKYDAANGKLLWQASAGAAKYVLRGSSLTDAAFSLDEETSQTEKRLDLKGGIYAFGVSAKSASDAEGPVSELEYRSYTDAHFGAQIGETDFYRVLDFEDEGVLDWARASDYKEWSSGVVGACGYEIADTVAQNATVDEDGDGKADIAKYGNIVRPRTDAPSQVLEMVAHFMGEKPRFAGVTFNLQEKITDFGRLYVDVYRAGCGSIGVMFDDGEGHRAVVYTEWGKPSYDPSAYKWATLSVLKSEILKQAPAFTGIEEITFYFRASDGGRIFFDNVRYEKTDLGDMGALTYSKANKKFTWDAVDGAKEYELYIDSAAEPIIVTENELDRTESPLAEGAHTARLIAVNGESRREKTYEIFVDKDMRFNVLKDDSTTEYILAAFDTNEYLQYIAPNNPAQPPQYSLSTEGLVITRFAAAWKAQGLKYTFPQAIDGKDVYKLHITYKAGGTGNVRVQYYDGDGKEGWLGLHGFNGKKFITYSQADADGYVTATIDMSKLYGVQSDAEGGNVGAWENYACNGLAAMAFYSENTNPSITVRSITYEKYPANTSYSNVTVLYDTTSFFDTMYTNVSYNLTKVGLGLSVPRGNVTATLKKDGGTATAFDLSDTAHKFEAGTYEIAVLFDNGIVTASGSKTFEVLYRATSDAYTVLADFDNANCINGITTQNGGAATFGKYVSSQSDSGDNAVFKDAVGGAVKLTFGAVWSGGMAKVSLGRTITVSGNDIIVLRLYSTNINKVLALYFPLGNAVGNSIQYSASSHNISSGWTTITVTAAQISSAHAAESWNGIENKYQFDSISFAVSEIPNDGISVYVDEIDITTNAGYGKPVSQESAEILLADFTGKSALPHWNQHNSHKNTHASALDLTMDGLKVSCGNGNWDAGAVYFYFPTTIDRDTIAEIKVYYGSGSPIDRAFYLIDDKGNPRNIGRDAAMYTIDETAHTLTIDVTKIAAYDGWSSCGENIAGFGITYETEHTTPYTVTRITYKTKTA